MNKRILITGSNGMLAKDIISVFGQTEKYDLFGIDVHENIIACEFFKFHKGDLTDNNFLEKIISDIKPDLIIHTAAIVDINLCESQPELANKLHVHATRQLAKHGSPIIYISTDSVFNGERGNYSEIDIPDPLNYYAASKLLGELALQAANSNSLVIRTNIYGFNKPLKSSLAEWGINNLINNKSIDGFSDILFNAIYTYHLAEILLKLFELKLHGCINVASRQTVSKYDFLRMLARVLGKDEELVRKSSSADIDFKVTRPKNTTLDVSKALEYVSLPTFEEGIVSLKEHYYKVYGK